MDLQPPASGQAILKIYDSENSTLTGKLVLAELYCDAGLSGLNHEFFAPVAVNRGIYAELTGTASYTVRYTA